MINIHITWQRKGKVLTHFKWSREELWSFGSVPPSSLLPSQNPKPHIMYYHILITFFLFSNCGEGVWYDWQVRWWNRYYEYFLTKYQVISVHRVSNLKDFLQGWCLNSGTHELWASGGSTSLIKLSFPPHWHLACCFTSRRVFLRCSGTNCYYFVLQQTSF